MSDQADREAEESRIIAEELGIREEALRQTNQTKELQKATETLRLVAEEAGRLNEVLLASNAEQLKANQQLLERIRHLEGSQ